METWHFVRGCPWCAELTFSEVGEWCFFSSTTKEWAFEKISQRIYDLVLQSFTPLKSYFHPSVESIFVGDASLGVGELRLYVHKVTQPPSFILQAQNPKKRCHTFFIYKDSPLAPYLAYNFSFLKEILNLREGVTTPNDSLKFHLCICYTKIGVSVWVGFNLRNESFHLLSNQ